MSFKIGFKANDYDERIGTSDVVEQAKITPVKSVVKVHFPSRGYAWSYYNDSFDLHKGNIVYVDGKLEGKPGIVLDVNYNFKIKISDYKKVIAVADTSVKGEVHFAGSHLVAFEQTVIPYEKVIRWFKAPDKPEDEIVCGNDDTSFFLDDLAQMNAQPDIMHRGYDYYYDDKVTYICINGENGHAIINGREIYEVEFKYLNGEISNLTCDCFCSYTCKHEVAAMLQLRDIIQTITNNYADKYEQTNYFAAISKSAFFSIVIDSHEIGSITLTEVSF